MLFLPIYKSTVTLFILLAGPLREEHFFSDAVGWFLVFICLFLSVGGYFYFKHLSQRFEEENKKISDKLSDRSYGVMMQKWDLERKNLTISQQNQEILDSLHYAKNIQSAIMPHASLINQLFREGFVLYLPKDIVSGDFYFWEQLDDLIYLGVADCTGHGVAGAFMSMVGNSLLKQIILQKKFTDPGEILTQLNEGIVDALRQKENSSHGGMDIALCVIDKKKKQVKFAGANRPLLIVRDFKEEVIKPDKLPIGGFMPDEDRVFKTQTIDLREGDHLYLFSDGYPDQFGGVDGKKLMTKKFRELLVNMHQTNMEHQRKTLDSYFQDWKGKFDQVDDVLVIGILI